jgi:hypothetical protein
MEFNGIEDVDYLKNKLFAGLKIPKAFLGYDETTEGKATLAAEDVRFARTIERIQRIVVSELTKIGIVHLYSQGYTDEKLVSFGLELTNSSTIYQQEKVSLWSEKVNLADSMKENKMLSEDWIYENIYGIVKDEVSLERDKVVEDTINQYRHDMIQQEGKDPAKQPSVAEEAKKKNKETLKAANDTRKTRDGKSDADVGRPKENQYYGTDNGSRGRDPLGKEKVKRDSKNKDRSIKHKYKHGSPLAREIAQSMNMFKTKKSKLTEDAGMLDESNLIDTDQT